MSVEKCFEQNRGENKGVRALRRITRIESFKILFRPLPQAPVPCCPSFQPILCSSLDMGDLVHDIEAPDEHMEDNTARIEDARDNVARHQLVAAQYLQELPRVKPHRPHLVWIGGWGLGAIGLSCEERKRVDQVEGGKG